MGCIHTPNPYSSACGDCRARELEAELMDERKRRVAEETRANKAEADAETERAHRFSETARADRERTLRLAAERERDERAERMKADAAELDRVREEWDKKDTEETVELRARAAELEAEVDRLRAERDSRPEITPEDAALLRDWMLSERAEACAEHPTPHWVDRVVDATCAHARKAKP